MDHYTLTLARELARQNGIALTPRHLEILDWVEEYYNKHRVGPLYKNITKATGAGKTEIDDLFPHGLASIFAWTGIPIHSPDNPCKAIPKIAVKEYREVYLDYSATTPVREEVLEWIEQLYQAGEGHANASSGSLAGKAAYDRLDQARAVLSDMMKVPADTLVFTGGGSESNNLAIKGWALSNWAEKGHIITSRIAHSAVLEPIRWLEKMGFEVTYLPPDEKGMITAQAVASVIRNNTKLVALLAANNEIGTINPVEAIGHLCRRKNLVFMVDAMQAFGPLSLAPEDLCIDLMSFSSHKIYGPKGVGGLYCRPGLMLTPLIHGGGQERGLRAGTENVAGISGMARAAQLMLQERKKNNHRLEVMRDHLLDEMRKIEPQLRLNGSHEHRLPHHLSVSFPGVTSGGLLLALAQIGISVSAGSACSAGKEESSHVLQAMGVDGSRYGTIRITLGHYTQYEDIKYFITYLPRILEALKAAPENPVQLGGEAHVG